ncbi:hypothetical protein [Alkalihalophilus marmarensis]|uniref:hypothetical protein n=1 Tax=Alkalihalophilus marmarensis TaxID=521377 RepID=UPI002DBC6F25|nr:hypothetical protein [Alkalihalophilus marmarensis]MEC2074421.1 hypothetical protein [Alkalihalophilus marmarensis]
MNKLYFIILHAINIFFLLIIGFVAVAFLANPSAGGVSPFNPILLGALVFLLLFWGANYVFQILKKDKWWVLLLGSGVFISMFSFVLFVIIPNLYELYYI